MSEALAYEVWRPQVGDRVRVRVNAECRYCLDASDPEVVAVALSQDGRTATVAEIGSRICFCGWDDEPDHQAHNVWVLFDQERPSDEREPWQTFDRQFAPQELEPLDSYICCACTEMVRRVDQDTHPCGPCQCVQPTEDDGE